MKITQKLPLTAVVPFLVLFAIMLGLAVAVGVKESRRAADREAKRDAENAARDIASTPVRVSQIPAPAPAEELRPAPASASAPEIRELTADAWREIAAAFNANPHAAKKRYAGVRWQFTGYTYRFVGNGGVLVAGVCHPLVAMRAGEVEKVTRDKMQRYEATLVECSPGELPEAVFRDGVLLMD
jgi:hypothetical protein